MADLSDAVSTTILGPVVLVVGLFAFLYVSAVVNGAVDSWLGRVTGLDAWKERTGFYARKIARPGTYYAAASGLKAGGVALAFGAVMLIRPLSGIQPGQARTILFLGIALLLIGSLVSAHWWRISSPEVQ